MKAKASVALKPLLLLVAAVLLSAITVVFGAAPLAALREQYGRTVLLMGGLVIVGFAAIAKLIPLALVVLLLVLLVGVHKEVEDHVPGLFWSGLISVVVALGFGAVVADLCFVVVDFCVVTNEYFTS